MLPSLLALTSIERDEEVTLLIWIVKCKAFHGKNSNKRKQLSKQIPSKRRYLGEMLNDGKRTIKSYSV